MHERESTFALQSLAQDSHFVSQGAPRVSIGDVRPAHIDRPSAVLSVFFKELKRSRLCQDARPRCPPSHCIFKCFFKDEAAHI